MTAPELVATLSDSELAEVCAAINSMHNEAQDATSAGFEQESETQVVRYSAQPKPTAIGKATDTTHIVPIQPTARVGTVSPEHPTKRHMVIFWKWHESKLELRLGDDNDRNLS